MALQLIGAGFGRTGTMSTYTALQELGYPCYHMKEVLFNKANKHHLDFWYQVAKAQDGKQHDWTKVFANYTATVDNPGCCVWKELFQAYPDARVLLTLHPRGAEAWYESTINTIYFTETLWQFKVLKAVVPMMRKFGYMTHHLMWERSLKGTMNDKEKALARYAELIEEVKATVPAGQLLIYSVDQGWGPLCEFLGVEVPDTEFPNVNDRAEIKKTIADFTKGAYMILALGVLLAVALVVGIIQWVN